MFILDVIPTIRIPKTDIQILSYFSKEPLPAGALARVPLGSRKINALVVDSHDLEKQRIQIKQSRFQTKNISAVISKESVLNTSQLQLLKYLADYYIASPALFVSAILPGYLTNKKTPVTLSCHPRGNGLPAISLTPRFNDIPPDNLIPYFFKLPVTGNWQAGNPENILDPRFRGDDNHLPVLIKNDDRLNEYEEIISLHLSDGKQILFLVPELARVEYYENYFSGYNPLILTSELTPKRFFESWDKIRLGQAQFVIGTKIAIFANFQSLGAIIIDEEQSREYKSRDMLPYYNAKTVALKTAGLSGAKIFLGSAAPSLETYYKVKEKVYELSDSSSVVSRQSSVIVVDMRNELLDKNYSSLSYQLKNEIERVLSDQTKKAVLFVPRRGSQSFYFCADCKHIEKCPHCDAHLVYHALQKNILLCHHCGYRQEPSLLCSKCGGHNIKTFGAGTQKVAEELKKFFGVEALVLDSDTAQTFKAQQKIIERFRVGDAQILIGTQTLLGEPDMPEADLVGIISLDNLLYIPDYKISEQIFQTIRGLAAYAKRGAPFFWQTYTPENETIQNIALQDYEKFYEREITARKALRYPPFSRIIKVTIRDETLPKTEARSAKITRHLDSALKKTGVEYEILGPVPAYAPKIKNQYIFTVILKIFSAKQKDLNTAFAPIQNEITIDVDPAEV